ncbi:DUF4345 domain-containing protein [Hyphomonas atlantica]|uniref:DUF4345 domain-containing protein n=1 Tax=Hyphomonas atlantica TaxID=1280948 RepID=A0A059E238_9PROT|nr:DUF4345 domain-containing protein [Hyphomonas atlantica]KCZ61612.1 hypothetical protein HY36_03445 [Hyphomonas atlantica]HAE93298.1 DUF4345 domain-containing protein [Hyphomonas atlantica]|tara:strand:- start:850 stop:1254 length:405 start_codon:yes stop_codon:yes gene_type:complete
MTQPLTRILLAVSGTTGLAIGLAVLFQPHAFLASSGISLGTDASLLSEIRAPGGLLLLCSLVALGGAIRHNLMQTGLVFSALIYSTYGLSRLVSIVLDGMPSHSLQLATFIELAIGALSLFALLQHKKATGAVK